MIRTIFLALLGLGLALVPSERASAQVVGSSFHLGNVLVEGPLELLPINGAGPLTPFVLPVPSRVAVMFSADCAVAGIVPVFLEVDIVIDGAVPVLPSHPNDLDGFCTNNHTAVVTDGFTGSAIVGRTLVTLAAGAHSVTVRARTSNNVTDGVIGDLSVLVMR